MSFGSTGQVLRVVVVPNGVAAANGVTWRKACYHMVHSGVLGAHRNAQVTFRLLERAVWWPSMEEDVKLWVSRCVACLKIQGRPTRVEAKSVKCAASTCWEEVSVDCEGPSREDYLQSDVLVHALPCHYVRADEIADPLRGSEGVHSLHFAE